MGGSDLQNGVGDHRNGVGAHPLVYAHPIAIKITPYMPPPLWGALGFPPNMYPGGTRAV